MLLVLVRPGEIINVKIFFGRPVFVVDEDASKFLSAKAVAMRESDVINVVVIIAKSFLFISNIAPTNEEQRATCATNKTQLRE